MWYYEKKLQKPISIKHTNPELAKVIISQYGGTFQNVRATYLTPPKYAF
ncbi:MAG: manganese catalase family protein [Clostridia bacterium]|nr:manganese catalase family protein [Clostridia bacterium]